MDPIYRPNPIVKQIEVMNYIDALKKMLIFSVNGIMLKWSKVLDIEVKLIAKLMKVVMS